MTFTRPGLRPSQQEVALGRVGATARREQEGGEPGGTRHLRKHHHLVAADFWHCRPRHVIGRLMWQCLPLRREGDVCRRAIHAYADAYVVQGEDVLHDVCWWPQSLHVM